MLAATSSLAFDRKIKAFSSLLSLYFNITREQIAKNIHKREQIIKNYPYLCRIIAIDNRQSMKKILFIISISLMCLITKAQDFPFRYLSPVTISPSEEANCMYFDKEGMMWIGTNAGVKSYDGYLVKTYKSSAFLPGILPNNTIRSITEDHNDNLWLGTRNGLVKMNKRTSEFKTYELKTEDQRIIYTLFTSKDGTLWVGTDGGLSYFNPKDESFYTYDNSNTWLIDEFGNKTRMCNYSVKSIVEDTNGDLLIGTWSAGLLRFTRGSHSLRRYPKLNATNSAYSLFFDRHHHLWIGTWGYGVIRMDNPANLQNPEIHQYPYSTANFDTFYKIIEDPITQTLWACTREGVCYLNEQAPEAGWQKFQQIGNYSLNYNNDIATDGSGNIWLCTQNNGIFQVSTQPAPFHRYNLDTTKVDFPINYIYAMLTTDGEWFWLGLNPYGIALHNRKTGNTYYNKDIPGFSGLNDRSLSTSISGITHRSNGEIWFADNSYGIIVKPKDKPAHILNHQSNAQFIRDDFVNTVFESRDHIVWIGQRSGMGVVYPNNTGTILKMQQNGKDFSRCDIRHIMQDKKGYIWVSTDNEGIIRISGNPRSPQSLKYKQYKPSNHNFAIDDATACIEDSHSRLWAISNSGGLFLYNKEEDRFAPMNRKYNIADDRVLSIIEDYHNSLWLTTDRALVHLVWGDKGNQEQPQTITYFTKEDGLGDILFAPNTCCKYGKELFFANKTSIVSFVPTPTIGQNIKNKKNLIITDILIDDVPFSQLDSTAKSEISKETPSYTRKLEIPATIKKFGIEFSLLTYGNTQKNVYAYRLEGYDDDWQYCNGETHRATFQNLPSGTYHLHVKATDSYGKWQELPYTITIKVLPPWYASRIAYMMYILLFIGGIFATARWYKEHIKTKNRLQMGVILTNITHELLTPLTVISATIYKLKNVAPQYEEDYLVMDNNINRTTRLLRQILEVRKSQAGQLRLLVSRGDLSSFIEKACENIRPMAEHQHITLKVELPKGECMGWFDTDKMDKILYNLLSNAIKYNKDGGNIEVSLSIKKDIACIKISDNGIGMSKDKLRRLYTRFFDGDYRKQKQPGTGIGLALTHDLIQLHHGDIKCESIEGMGTTFIVNFPTNKTAYAQDEIDVSNVSRQVDKLSVETVSKQSGEAANKQEETNKEKSILAAVKPSVVIRKGMSRVLVVEDNEELLALMHQMLSQNFHVFTAKNGKQALNVMHKEQLDLVVSDVMMPVMDGIELTKTIKSDKNFWQLPVILLTAKNKDEDKTEGYATGADAYITKPFKFDELTVRINTLIANRKKVQESIVQDIPQDAQQKETSEQKASAHFSDPDKAFIKKATELVMQHLDDSDYDRDSFATDMAMGASTLYNKVKATTGQTVVAFITGIRLREAKRILDENPGILISDVATQVGFNTPKYFSKCFKKEFGLLPKEYVEEGKKE